jgi:hypothetical protein
MIKVKALRAMAHKNGLKLSATALAPLDALAREIAEVACTKALLRNDPKLEAEHFGNLKVVFSKDEIKPKGKGRRR